jgi:hypothetical protein
MPAVSVFYPKFFVPKCFNVCSKKLSLLHNYFNYISTKGSLMPGLFIQVPGSADFSV